MVRCADEQAANKQMGAIWTSGMDFEAAFRDEDRATVVDAFAAWQAECEHARRLTAEAPSLDAAGERGGQQYTLRWVLTNMIEEYARHNGHADLLRERIDGATGQ